MIKIYFNLETPIQVNITLYYSFIGPRVKDNYPLGTQKTVSLDFVED